MQANRPGGAIGGPVRAFVDRVVVRLIYPSIRGQIQQDIRRSNRDIRRETRRLNRAVVRTDGRRVALRRRLRRVEGQSLGLRADVRSVQRSLAVHAEHTSALITTANLLLGPEGRNHPRLLRHDQVDRLAAEIASLSVDGPTIPSIATSLRTLISVESLGVGRVAGRTSNIIGKLASIPLLRPPGSEALEIGTLYGLFAVSMLKELDSLGGPWGLTVVDPLAGHQEQPSSRGGGGGGREVPVTSAVFTENVGRFGFSHRTRLVQHKSTSPMAIDAISDRQYGLIVVDGDHSANGVLHDLSLLPRIALKGAVVVVDDYGDPAWPGVKAALDRHLETSRHLSMLGTVATSAFLRVL